MQGTYAARLRSVAKIPLMQAKVWLEIYSSRVIIQGRQKYHKQWQIFSFEPNMPLFPSPVEGTERSLTKSSSIYFFL
jgi:hypothetical protein